MNHSPAQILAALLMDGSEALFTNPTDLLDWPLYISSLPDVVSVALSAAVYDTTPDKKGRLLSGLEIWSYGIQIKIRSTTYLVGWQKAEAVSGFLMNLLNEYVSVDESSYTVEQFSQTSRILSLGQDEQRRSLFAINGLVTIPET